MPNFLPIVNIVLPVLVVLFIGFLSRRRGFLSPEQVAGLKQFIVTFTLPPVLFRAVSGIDYSLDVLFVALLVFAACCIAYLVGKAVCRFDRNADALLPFLTTAFEAGMMGYALYTMIFGAEHLPAMAAVAFGGDLFVFTLYMTLLKRRSGIGLSQTLRETYTSPIFLAIALGILTGATGLWGRFAATGAGSVTANVLDFLAAPTSCGILFVVGYGIDFSGGAVRKATRAAILRFLTMALLGAATYFVCTLLPSTDVYRKWAVILLFTLPGPYVLPVFVKGESGERYASTCLSLYTLVSVVLFCIIAAIAV